VFREAKHLLGQGGIGGVRGLSPKNKTRKNSDTSAGASPEKCWSGGAWKSEKDSGD